MKFYRLTKSALRGIFLFILMVAGQTGYAQNSTSSPYSRYGVGDLQFGGFVKNLGMGGVSYGVTTPFNINFSNPASYKDLNATTFELGANADFMQLRNSSGTGEADNISFGYFALGFPVKQKKWGMTLGLLPYSNVGYSFSKDELDELGDRRTLSFSGTGGINQFFIGNGITLAKGLSLGVNASFLFGTLNQVRRISYPDGGYINSRITDANTVNDIYFSFGLQQTFDSLRWTRSDSLKIYDKEKQKNNDSLEIIGKSSDKTKFADVEASLLARNKQLDSLSDIVVTRKQRGPWSMTFGLTGAPSMGLRGTRSTLAENYLLTGIGTEIVRDTIRQEDVKGSLVMPLTLGFGVAMKQGNKWLAGADFSLQNWQDYSLFGQSDSLANSWRVAVGAQLIPNDRSIKSYLSLMNYRLGFHYEQTYLNLYGSQLNQMGVTLGLSFPVKRSASFIHMAIEAGKRGTTANKLIEENYIKCSLGFTLNDRWFVKPKFD
jgi:hypothetical protein